MVSVDCGQHWDALSWLVMGWEGLDHCDWCHSWAGGPGCFRKAGWANNGEQTSDLHASVASASVTACRFLPWVPAGCAQWWSLNWKLWAEMSHFLPKLFLVIHHSSKNPKTQLLQGAWCSLGATCCWEIVRDGSHRPALRGAGPLKGPKQQTVRSRAFSVCSEALLQYFLGRGKMSTVYLFKAMTFLF